jgi:ankyrin repeat protein
VSNKVLTISDNENSTALHWACCNNWFFGNMTAFLVDKGADIKVKDNKGNTALHLICFQAQSYTGLEPEAAYKKIIDLLVSNSGNMEAKNIEGKRPKDSPFIKGIQPIEPVTPDTAENPYEELPAATVEEFQESPIDSNTN